MSLYKDTEYKMLIKAHISDLIQGLQVAHIKTSLTFAQCLNPLERYKDFIYTTRESHYLFKFENLKMVLPLQIHPVLCTATLCMPSVQRSRTMHFPSRSH